MNKVLFISIIYILLINNTLSQMAVEKIEDLRHKVTKKIDIFNYNSYLPLQPLNNIYEKGNITYDPNKIKQIIKSNGFPESFNFIDEYKPTVNIKDQKSCGSCWAFATSTALAYRYKKQGIDVDLSPQSLLSCFVRDCDEGGYILDSQFYTVKGGVTTETCVPFSSGNGITIEACPTKCKGEEEFKKYYAKNSYATSFDYSSETYYDIVTVIMDQLVNYGPVVSGISCYEDFQDMMQNSRCKNIIYKYDGKSDFAGGHAIVIVGYGYENSKYYWIIQNSWGSNFCDKGFAKIEFAEIGIENVAFSEPYIEDKNKIAIGKEITAAMQLQDDCKIAYTTDSNDYEDSFELNFESRDSYTNFYYQCSKDPTKKGNSGICSFNFESFYNNEKGYYQYKNNSPLKNDKNKFTLNFPNLNAKRFYFYGADYITHYYIANKEYYVSENGNGFILARISPNYDSNFISKIYPNKNINTAFSDCQLVDIGQSPDYYLIYCKMSQNDINIIPKNNNLPIAYDILCGNKEETAVTLHRLDTSKYPIFRIKNIVMPYEEDISYPNEILIIADIEGSVSGIKSSNDINIFVVEIEIYLDLTGLDALFNTYLVCGFKNPSKLEKGFEISCYSEYTYKGLKYKKIVLTPYYSPLDMITPYEVIIGKKINGIKFEEYIRPYPTDSKFIKSSLFFLLLLFLLL